MRRLLFFKKKRQPHGRLALLNEIPSEL
jgi:hypothetical protein